jgi:RNA polymerase sigma factor (sigma-70 family)
MEGDQKTGKRLLSRIPFSVDDTDQVNDLYFANYSERTAENDEVIDVWTYCYIRRYFQLKYARDFDGSLADYEKLIAECFRKVHKGRPGLGLTSRYANWVSVICKNTFLNHVRSKRRYVSIERSNTPLFGNEPGAGEELDTRLVFAALKQAIERLPSFLQTIATRRIVDEQDYSTIAEETGKAIPTVRSYVNKALIRLRNDARFMKYFERHENEL